MPKTTFIPVLLLAAVSTATGVVASAETPNNRLPQTLVGTWATNAKLCGASSNQESVDHLLIFGKASTSSKPDTIEFHGEESGDCRIRNIVDHGLGVRIESLCRDEESDYFERNFYAELSVSGEVILFQDVTFAGTPSYYNRCAYTENLGKSIPLCNDNNALWSTEKDGVRNIVYSAQTKDYLSDIYFEEWRNNKLAWRMRTSIECSMGASICRIDPPDNSPPAQVSEGVPPIIFERIDSDNDGLSEWVIFSAMAQHLYYNGGAKVEWMNGFSPSNKAERITPPNIYKFISCK